MLKCAAVFQGVCLTWVFFRARTLPDALTIIRRIAVWSPGDDFFHDFAWYKCLLALLFGLSYFLLTYHAKKGSVSQRWAWAASTVGVLVIILFGAASQEFIYFVF